MEKLIIVRYGEMMLKGKNLKDFKNHLANNLHNSFFNMQLSYKQKHEHLLITNFSDHLEDLIIDKLNHIPGLYSYSIAYLVKNNEKEVLKISLDLLKNYDNSKTLKIETKRKDKTLPYTSQEFSLMMATKILIKYPHLNIDLINPQNIFNYELWPNNEVLIYFNKHKLLGGYPGNTQAKILHLISGGIDSPVAAIELIRKGVNLSLLHFESSPLTPLEGLDKVIALAEEISKYTYKQEINLYIVPFKPLHTELINKIDDSYIINIMRRMMYRISSRFADSLGINIISNGDSIGQVASQTLESIISIDNVINKTIIRPLATMDKDFIINLAYKYNTYKTSIIPFNDCCTAYLPKKPTTKPHIKKALYYESLINYEKIINEIMPTITLIKVTPNKKIRLTNLGLDFLEAIKHVKA